MTLQNPKHIYRLLDLPGTAALTYRSESFCLCMVFRQLMDRDRIGRHEEMLVLMKLM